MNKATPLNATVRTNLGRKVKHLRAEGSLPATVYGKQVEGASLTVKTDEFERVYDEVGSTGLIDLTIDGEKRPVLVYDVQVDPVTGEMLHVEFYQVNLKEKVQAAVPLTIVGESPMVENKEGALLTSLDEVEVEALPAEIPDHFDVDVSGLVEMDAEVTVGALKVPTGVTVVTDASLVIAKIGPLVSKEAEQQAAEEAAAQAAAATADAEPAEETPAGDAPAEAPQAEEAPVE